MLKARLLKIYIKEGDKYKGEIIYKYILKLLQSNDIVGATVYKGVCGYGIRGKAEFDIFRLSMNLPMVIECIDSEEKIDKVLPKLKEVIGENGFIVVIDCAIPKLKRNL